MRIEEKEVVDIVAAGGRVLALAFYGGDDHTATNLSEILRSFGIACDACAVRDAQLPFPGPEGATAMLVKGASEFLSPTERFFLPNCAPLTVTLPATSILATGEDAHTLHFTYKGKSTRVEQVSKSADGAQIVGAIRRYGRKGGRVAVLGSWEVFADKALADTRYANRELLKRLITWLLEANNDTAQT